MNLREVTIGRSNNCDIYLDQRCIYASNIHATIYYDGNQLMYKDTSTNGTMINNVSVRKRTIPINRGDVIMIAGQYPISWNQIDSFFPYSTQKQICTLPSAPTPISVQHTQQPVLSKWNWAAFVIPGIWGLFNGCWWLFLLQFIPVPLVISIIAAIKGNEWAWHNKSWNNSQHFMCTQKIWNIVGLTLFCISITSSIIYCLVILNL